MSELNVFEQGGWGEENIKMCATKMFSSNTPQVLVKIVYFKPSFLRYSILRKCHHGHRQQQCPCAGLLLHASHFSRSKPPAVGLYAHERARASERFTYFPFPCARLPLANAFPHCVVSRASNDRCSPQALNP